MSRPWPSSAPGQKRSHWMWFIFPQHRDLGRSATAKFYGLSGVEEARAYAAHPLLGPRLRECAAAVLEHLGDKSAEAILGPVDAMKLRSSMDIFAEAVPDEPLVRRSAAHGGLIVGNSGAKSHKSHNPICEVESGGDAGVRMRFLAESALFHQPAWSRRNPSRTANSTAMGAQWRLKYCTSRSCFSAAARLAKVPRLRLLPVFGSHLARIEPVLARFELAGS